jgi:hypothetical protein
MKTQDSVQRTVASANPEPLLRIAKRLARSASGKLLLVVAIVISLATIPLLTRANQANEKRTLAGNWMGTVTRVNAPPGQSPTALSLMTFFEDGNLLQEGSDPSLRSTGRGKWERVGHQQFTQEFLNWRFDAARNYIGTRVVRSTITLSDDGNEYQAQSAVEVFDAAGNLVSSGQGATEVAHRLFPQ